MNAAPQELESYQFDASAEQWQPCRALVDAPQKAQNKLTIATQNIWFSPYEQKKRLDGLVAELERLDADVIGLQEVTVATLSQLLSHKWVRSELFVTDITGETFHDYGVLLLSRLPILSCGVLDLPSVHGRRLLVARLVTGEGTISVSTAHLESLSFNVARRREQLETVFSVLEHLDEDCLFMGDFNFDEGAPEESSALDPSFLDTWKTQHPSDPGFTVDTYRNSMRLAMHGSVKRARYDRILLRAPKSQWTVKSVNLLGPDAIEGTNGEVFISDHFGVVTTLEPAKHK